MDILFGTDLNVGSKVAQLRGVSRNSFNGKITIELFIKTAIITLRIEKGGIQYGKSEL